MSQTAGSREAGQDEPDEYSKGFKTTHPKVCFLGIRARSKPHAQEVRLDPI
jgi:hypothetical protein